MKKVGLTAMLAAGAMVVLLSGAYTLAGAGGGKSKVKAETLSGYQESPGVSSTGTGSFSAKIDDDASTITYELTYDALSAPALAGHIHFGNRFTSGGVSAFLCGGGSKPPCPPGTTSPATVTGTIIPTDVVGPAGQGIAPGEFAELVAAIRAGVTYANVHTSNFPGGEIRGQINDDNH